MRFKLIVPVLLLVAFVLPGVSAEFTWTPLENAAKRAYVPPKLPDSKSRPFKFETSINRQPDERVVKQPPLRELVDSADFSNIEPAESVAELVTETLRILNNEGTLFDVLRLIEAGKGHIERTDVNNDGINEYLVAASVGKLDANAGVGVVAVFEQVEGIYGALFVRTLSSYSRQVRLVSTEDLTGNNLPDLVVQNVIVASFLGTELYIFQINGNEVETLFALFLDGRIESAVVQSAEQLPEIHLTGYLNDASFDMTSVYGTRIFQWDGQVFNPKEIVCHDDPENSAVVCTRIELSDE